MNPMAALLFVIFIISSHPVFADIIADEDLESLESSPEGSIELDADACKPHASVAVQIERGKFDFPYGPPGLNSYKGSSRASGIAFGFRKTTCEVELPEAFQVSLLISNHFPAGGRLYEVQAVSWTEMGLRTDAYQGLVSIGEVKVGLSAGLRVDYDRFQYARGTYSFQSFGVSGGFRNDLPLRIFDRPAILGVDVRVDQLVLSRILLKYDSAKTGLAADATTVELNSNGHLKGHDLEVGGRLGFSSLSRPSAVSPYAQLQHEITVGWISKKRESSRFVNETDSTGVEKNTIDLNMQTAAWLLRWTERI